MLTTIWGIVAGAFVAHARGAFVPKVAPREKFVVGNETWLTNIVPPSPCGLGLARSTAPSLSRNVSTRLGKAGEGPPPRVVAFVPVAFVRDALFVADESKLVANLRNWPPNSPRLLKPAAP